MNIVERCSEDEMQNVQVIFSSLLRIRSKTGQIWLIWTHLPDTEHYDFLRGTQLSGPFQKIAETQSTDSGFLDSTVTNDILYYYRVERFSHDTNIPSCTSEVIAAVAPSRRGRAVIVPDVLGQQQTQAEQTLRNANLMIGTTSEEPSQSIPEGAILLQDPPPNSVVPREFMVDLVVSSGPEEITVTIDSPSDQSLFNISEVSVSGSISNNVVNVDLNGVSATITDGTFAGIIPLEEGVNTLIASATDAVGNEASDRLQVHLDTLLQTIFVTSPNNGDVVNANTITVTGTVATDTTEVKVNNTISTLVNGSFTAADIMLVPGGNTLLVTATDHAGNTNTATITVTLISDAPIIRVDSPSNSAVIQEFSATLQGTVTDLDFAELTINGTAVQVINDTFLHTVPLLLEGANTITLTATDQAQNTSILHFTVNRDTSKLTELPEPAVVVPTTNTNLSTITLTGAALPNTTLIVDGGTSQTTVMTDASGHFSVDISLNPNQLNRLFITNTDGVQSSHPLSVEIIQDSQSPFIFVDFPQDGAELTNDFIVVAGRVGDVLSGFMGLDVTVNGIPAEVIVGIGTNGSFEAQNVPLTPGTNTISATATDIHGNTINKTITVEKIDIPAGSPSMVTLSGDLQTAEVNTLLSDPIVVHITQSNGSPFVGKLVTFEVIRSDGRLSPDGSSLNDGSQLLQVRTDENGEARAYWTLGSDAGCGNNRIAVTSTGIAGSVFFCASADAAPATQINVGSGDNQIAAVNNPTSEKLRVPGLMIRAMALRVFP